MNTEYRHCITLIHAVHTNKALTTLNFKIFVNYIYISVAALIFLQLRYRYLINELN